MSDPRFATNAELPLTEEKSLARSRAADTIGDRALASAIPTASSRARNEEDAVDALVTAVTRHFRSFGGGRDSDMNPMAHALKDCAPMFAAGVDIRDVVTFVRSAVLADAAIDPSDKRVASVPNAAAPSQREEGSS